MTKSFHLHVIYTLESFRQRLLDLHLPALKISWLKLDADHPLRHVEMIQLTEPLEGSDGQFIRSIIDDRPDLLLMEIEAEHDATLHLIHVLKTSAATRRIPIVAVGRSEEELLQARQAGADQALLNNKWPAKLGSLILHLKDKIDVEGMEQACQGSLHASAAKGIKAVNAGQYYQAHELLEEAWMAVDETEGILYRVLLQVAVTYLQIQRHNLRGALKMLLRMRQWLDPLPETCRGVDVKELRGMMASLREALERLSLTQPLKAEPDWFQPIPLISPIRDENQSNPD
jgi:predicted metal-dependent hydrolase